MERRFKVYVYEEGDLPISHDGPCKNIYSIEGRFIHEMENGAKRFRTSDGERAHVYFMPFSVTWMVKYLYKPNSYDQNPLRLYVGDYVKLISLRYPFWNRTNGADHFMVACHDWVSLSFNLFLFYFSFSFFLLYRFHCFFSMLIYCWVAYIAYFIIYTSINFSFLFT